MILNKEISPECLKSLDEKELRQLCSEIRRFLIKTVSKTGGHLASNLGTVELTVALHKVFSVPHDKIIFDVGHQCYAHKLLTGRFERFSTLRSEGGVGGFPRPAESPYDAFIGGHSGISVSAALGIAEAMRLAETLKDGKNVKTPKTIAVAGDGAFTDGGIYEGLNNAGKSNANLLVILNDNGMSISKNTGAIAAYLSSLRSTRKYHKAKTEVKSFLEKNRMGEALSGAVSVTKKFVKNAIYQSNFFENLGFKYYGIVDGHNLRDLIEVLELTKLINAPCLIHIKTKKGKGFKPAEINSGEYHGIDKEKSRLNEQGVKPAEINSGEYHGVSADSNSVISGTESFSTVFGKEIAELGEKDERIVLISAAMKYATGCNYFNDKFPERFYDCGIAEAHAVTFAAGLASGGALPVFAVYSTFSQRGFDRLLHDCAIEGLHIVLAIDRAGVVGEDGETHQGVFDVAMLSMIPGFTVFSPSTADELRVCLKRALYECEGPVAVRYPRGGHNGVVGGRDSLIKAEANEDYCLFKENPAESHRLNITYGRLACKLSKSGDLITLLKIKPLPDGAIKTAMFYSKIVFYEEGVERGGIGEALLLRLIRMGWKGEYDIKAVTGFIPAADADTQLRNIVDA